MTTTRRQFLIGAGVAAGSAAAAGALGRPLAEAARGDDVEKSLPVDRVVRTTCSPNCTGSCGQLAFVRDGNVVKVQQAADYPENEYNPRGCMKGISYHLLIHGPDRILKPLVRTGERGSGEFREATWDEVLDRISGELKRIGEQVGLGQRPRLQPGARLGLRAEGRRLPRLRGARHDPRHQLRLQRRPAHGHADHLRRAERRAREQGLGQQPLHPADRRQPAGDAHPRRALHPRRGGEGRAAGGRGSHLLVHRLEGGRPHPHQARHRRGVRPRPVPPGAGGRQGRLGLHAHVHRRAAARAHGHRQAAARRGARPRRGPGPGPGRGRRPRRVRRQGAARRHGAGGQVLGEAAARRRAAPQGPLRGVGRGEGRAGGRRHRAARHPRRRRRGAGRRRTRSASPTARASP